MLSFPLYIINIKHMKENLIWVTCVQHRNNGKYTVQFREIDSTQIDDVIHYTRSRIIYLTENEFEELKHMPPQEVEKMSQELLNI